MTLTARFLLGFAVVATVAVYLLTAAIIRRVERQYMEAAEEPMVDVANVLAEMVRVDLVNNGYVLDAAALERAWRAGQTRMLNAQIYDLAKKHVDMQVYLADAQGRILFDTSGREAPGRLVRHRDVMLTLAGQYGARATHLDPSDPLSLVMYVGAPVVVDGRRVGVVSVAKPLRSLLVFIRTTENWLKGMALSVLAALMVGVFLAAQWAAKPLQRLTDHALAVSRGARPLPPKMPGRHLKTLAGALEDMRDALEGREYVERYVQSLTHELKSPVAAIAGAAEILQGDVAEPRRRRFLENIQTESARLQDLLERLLQLAALEKQKSLATRERADLWEIIDRAWDHLGPQAARREVGLTKKGETAAKIQGDPWLLELAVGNLLQNALEFSPQGGRIEVQITSNNALVTVTVQDEGPGLPEYARERVFERFYSLPRPDSGKKSSGLGLCFVREVAQLHGGTAELVNREGGRGARAMLLLPLG
jgi:two-component system sensor histidine kinase CreC